MPAVLDPFVQARQTLTPEQLQAEAVGLYLAERERIKLRQAAIAERIKTAQSAVSAAFSATPEEATRHAAVYERFIGAYHPRYRVSREETVRYRVERKPVAG